MRRPEAVPACVWTEACDSISSTSNLLTKACNGKHTNRPTESRDTITAEQSAERNASDVFCDVM